MAANIFGRPAPDTVRIVIVRHGETRLNHEGKTQGRVDEPLNENGRRLAEITGNALKDVRFDAVFASPLKRAYETGVLVLGRNTASFTGENADRLPEITVDERITEYSWGDYDGLGCVPSNFELPMTPEEYNLFFTDPFRFPPAPNGETIREVCERTKAFYEDIAGRPDLLGKTVLVATHGCALRGILRNVYDDTTSGGFWHGHTPPNLAVNMIEVKDGKGTLVWDDRIFYDPSECVNPYEAVRR